MVTGLIYSLMQLDHQQTMPFAQLKTKLVCFTKITHTQMANMVLEFSMKCLQGSMPVDQHQQVIHGLKQELKH